MNKIQQLFTIMSTDVLFNQIDFFNNGYIDATSFVQFIKHYSQYHNNNNNNNNKQCLVEQKLQIYLIKIIRYIKGSAKAQKIFYADFQNIIQDINIHNNNTNNNNNSNLLQQSNINAQLISNINSSAVHDYQHSNIHHINSNIHNRTVGHIARTVDIQLMQSRTRKMKHHQSYDSNHNNNTNNSNSYNKINKCIKSIDDNDNSHLNINSAINIKDNTDIIHKIIKQQANQIPYQQQICANHWRNGKYLQKLKQNMNITNFNHTFRNAQQFSTNNNNHNNIYNSNNNMNMSIKHNSNSKYKTAHNSNTKTTNDNNISKAKILYTASFNIIPNLAINNISIIPSQIIYQFRYLSQLYNKWKLQIQSMIKYNKFTFLNAFHVIDVYSKGYITYQQLCMFVDSNQIYANQQKVCNLFDALKDIKNNQLNVQQQQQNNYNKSDQFNESNNQTQYAIYYHKYIIKIFKLSTLLPIFQQCKNRRPFLSQQWPISMQTQYCRFLHNIISIFYQIKIAKQTLIKMFNIYNITSVIQMNNVKQGILRRQDKYTQIQDKFRVRLEQIFQEGDIHCDKLKQTLGKNSDTFVKQLYGEQTVLEAYTFIKFLATIV